MGSAPFLFGSTSCLVVLATTTLGTAAATCPAGAVPFAAPTSSSSSSLWKKHNAKKTTDDDVVCLSFDDAVSDATDFLRANLPPWDQPVTLLGVPDGVDGLDDGIASVGVNMSVTAQATYPWAGENIPQDIFNEYVATYAMTNEPRTHWRGFFLDVVEPMIAGLTDQDDVVAVINGYGPAGQNVSIWRTLNITFKSSMTPLIFDPLSTVAFGYASCTGISAVFVAALRAAGVPARVAGTPAWHGDASNGNHNWVEIYRTKTQEWVFIEGHPSGGSETLDNPCDKWFCNAAHFSNNATSPTPTSPVFAARFDARANDSAYPLAWDPDNLDVPGVNRTAYYSDACSQC